MSLAHLHICIYIYMARRYFYYYFAEKHYRMKIYSILNKMGKKPNDVPFHMRNVGLRSTHIDSFHMLSALLMTIITLSFRILGLTQN